MHIFGKLEHIFGKSARIFGKLVHIFARKIGSRTSKQVPRNLGPLWQPGVYNDTLAKGAFAVLKPFCGSVSCLHYFSSRPQDFERLCQACKEQCSAIYDRIDGHVSVDALKRAGKVGYGCNTKGIRQDMPGLAPPFKYVRCEATNMNMGGNLISPENAAISESRNRCDLKSPPPPQEKKKIAAIFYF